MTYHFNLSPGALKKNQYTDKKYRIFEVKNTWSGAPTGGVQRVDLVEIETGKINKIDIETFKEYLTEKKLIQI